MGPANRYWNVPPNVPHLKWEGGELLAWRLWRLGLAPDGTFLLVSMFQNTVWEGPVVAADHRPLPVPTCGSGIYALKPSVRPVRDQYDWALGGDTWVRGWVALSGQVVEHLLGYRAERVVIRRLRLGAAAHRCYGTPQEIAAVRQQLEQRYQCPVRISPLDARIARGFRSAVRPVAVTRLVPSGGTPPPPPPPPSLPADEEPPPRCLRWRTNRPKGVSPDRIKYDAVRRVFAQAERYLGSNWRLSGRGHCERVTLKAHYSRHARLGAPHSVAYFSPSGCLGRVHVFPAELVRRAAWILKVDAKVLVSRWL
jgi:hypothetical protein